MTRLVIRAAPSEEEGVARKLTCIYCSNVEGILKPSAIEMMGFARAKSASVTGGMGASVAGPSGVIAGPSSTPAPVQATATVLEPVKEEAEESPNFDTRLIVERRIAVEYSPGEHFQLLHLLNPENEMVPEMPEREELALNLLDTMVIAHELGLTHGQLNSERIYVHSEEPICYVADFFIGKSYNPYICPRDYRGPESILRCEDKDTPQRVDVWALGCLLYELLTTEPLFMLPSSRDEVGVTVPMLIQRQLATIAARVSQFPNNSLSSSVHVGTNTNTSIVGNTGVAEAQHSGSGACADEDGKVGRTSSTIIMTYADVIGRDFGEYGMMRIAKMFSDCEDPLKRAYFLNPDAPHRRPPRDYLAKKEDDEDAISEPFVWAIQQCLTFCPSLRPSLRTIRDGLLRRLGHGDEEILKREVQIVEARERLRLVRDRLEDPAAGNAHLTPLRRFFSEVIREGE